MKLVNIQNAPNSSIYKIPWIKLQIRNPIPNKNKNLNISLEIELQNLTLYIQTRKARVWTNPTWKITGRLNEDNALSSPLPFFRMDSASFLLLDLTS